MEADLTVAEVFGKANLWPCGPVRWGTQISESRAGVYVVARVADPTISVADGVPLPFIDPLPPDLDVVPDFERQRWLPNEPIVYIGQTGRSIHTRLGAFYRQKCGDRSPHAGGQVVKLLQCDLWVYWLPATRPRDSEQAMIRAFKEQLGREPFANWDGKRRRRRRRIRLKD